MTATAAAGCEAYIYYKIDSAAAEAALAAARAMLIGLMARHAGLSSRLLRRPEASEGDITLMEVHRYTAASGGIDAQLLQAIERAGSAMAPWLRGQRHVEVFVPLSA